MSKEYVRCLSIAGLDPSGGAGLLADVKTFAALGCQGMAVATCLTVQNTLGVCDSTAVDAALVERQLEALFDDTPPHAVKIGMTGTAATIGAIARVLDRHKPPFVVLDPVVASSGGFALAADGVARALVETLMPRCTLVAVNRDELSLAAGEPPAADHAAAQAAAMRLAARTGSCILLKSGHFDETKDDVLLTPRGVAAVAPGRPVATRNTHGTGCTLTSAIAAWAALGLGMADAVREAKRYVQQALDSGRDVAAGRGRGGMNHLFAPRPAVVR